MISDEFPRILRLLRVLKDEELPLLAPILRSHNFRRAALAFFE